MSVVDITGTQRDRSGQLGGLTDRQTNRLAEISSATVIDQVPDICYATPRV